MTCLVFAQVTLKGSVQGVSPLLLLTAKQSVPSLHGLQVAGTASCTRPVRPVGQSMVNGVDALRLSSLPHKFTTGILPAWS